MQEFLIKIVISLVLGGALGMEYWLAGHKHSDTASVRRIVGFSMLVFGIVSNVAATDFYDSRSLRSADYALRKDGFNHLGKERHNLKSHPQKSPELRE